MKTYTVEQVYEFLDALDDYSLIDICNDIADKTDEKVVGYLSPHNLTEFEFYIPMEEMAQWLSENPNEFKQVQKGYSFR